MKCHKFEINLRKEVLRKIDELNYRIKREQQYRRSCYESSEFDYVTKTIESLESQLAVLNELVENANKAIS